MKHFLKRFLFTILIVSLTQMACQADSIQIGCFNITASSSKYEVEHPWMARKEALESFFAQHKFHIIAFQGIGANQIDDILQPLKERAFNFVSATRGSSWLGLAKDESQVIAWNDTTFQLVAWSSFKINTPAFSPFSVQHKGLLPRICLWAILKSRETGKEICVMNIHLDHMFQGARISGLQHLSDFINQSTSKHPTILMGTFNTDLHDECGRILEDAGFTNMKLLSEKTSGLQTTAHYWGKRNEAKVDHFYIKDQGSITIKEFEVISEDSIQQAPSQHRPLLVTLNL